MLRWSGRTVVHVHISICSPHIGLRSAMFGETQQRGQLCSGIRSHLSVEHCSRVYTGRERDRERERDGQTMQKPTTESASFWLTAASVSAIWWEISPWRLYRSQSASVGNDDSARRSVQRAGARRSTNSVSKPCAQSDRPSYASKSLRNHNAWTWVIHESTDPVSELTTT